MEMETLMHTWSSSGAMLSYLTFKAHYFSSHDFSSTEDDTNKRLEIQIEPARERHAISILNKICTFIK